MKNRVNIAVMCLALGTLLLSGVAFAHGTEKHGKTTKADAQMKKLHAMMPMFSVASAGLETALEKSDLTTVESDAKKIIEAVPDLKKSKPHKNLKQRKKFVELSIKLEEAVFSTVDLARKGDFAGAKVAFKKVEEVCADCHAKFRD